MNKSTSVTQKKRLKKELLTFGYTEADFEAAYTKAEKNIKNAQNPTSSTFSPTAPTQSEVLREESRKSSKNTAMIIGIVAVITVLVGITASGFIFLLNKQEHSDQAIVNNKTETYNTNITTVYCPIEITPDEELETKITALESELTEIDEQLNSVTSYSIEALDARMKLRGTAEEKMQEYNTLLTQRMRTEFTSVDPQLIQEVYLDYCVNNVPYVANLGTWKDLETSVEKI